MRGSFALSRARASAGAGARRLASSSAAAAPPPPQSLDAVVAGLDRPETLSTLAKTSLDWDQFKQAQGLDEAFESRAAQGGFVERQAFLARVDERAALADRERRIEERRQREMGGGGGGGAR